jgi:hypothetical protein
VTTKKAESGLEGEGSYTATRNFDETQRKFVSEHKADIPKMGQDAKDALEGPEGETLRKADEKAKAKARK